MKGLENTQPEGIDGSIPKVKFRILNLRSSRNRWMVMWLGLNIQLLIINSWSFQAC